MNATPATNFWRWKALQLTNLRVSDIFGLVVFVSGAAFFLKHFSSNNDAAFFESLVSSRYFIAAMTLLILSNIGLDIMEHKVQLIHPEQVHGSLLSRHKIVSKLYEELYGRDIFVLA